MKAESRRFVGLLAMVAGLDASQPPDIGAVIQNLAQQFASVATLLLTTINSAILDVSRLAYTSVLLIGLLLYFTHLDRRHGRDLIIGGVILAVLFEFVFPWLTEV